MRKVELLQLIGKQYLLLIPAICCFALATTAESLAADNIKSDQQDTMKTRLVVEQPDELVITGMPYELLLKTGYRKDNLNWSEAGGSIDILSELKWENLKIAQVCAAARFYFYSDLSLRGTFAYGSIQSGSNQDSDYNGNGLTLEFSRSNNKGGGKVRDGSIGLGKTLNLSNYVGENSLSVTPLVGLSIHQQNLKMTDGFQTLPATGSFPGLNSSYDAKWQGPWVGIDALLKSGRDWSLTVTGEYHWADYSAHANWNLRPEFSHPLSFIHTTKGQGILLAMEATYHVSKNWRFGFSVELQQMSTGAGIDQTFFSDGTVGYYSLNEVNWESTSYSLIIIYPF